MKKKKKQKQIDERKKLKFDANDPVDRFLYTLRRAYPNFMCSVFLNGSCFELYRILKNLFPKAICYYSPIEGHIYTKIDTKFYDIRGSYSQLNRDTHIALPETMDKAQCWARGNTMGYFVDKMFENTVTGDDYPHDVKEFKTDLVP